MLYIRLCFVRLRMSERARQMERERKSVVNQGYKDRQSCYLIITIFKKNESEREIEREKETSKPKIASNLSQNRCYKHFRSAIQTSTELHSNIFSPETKV